MDDDLGVSIIIWILLLFAIYGCYACCKGVCKTENKSNDPDRVPIISREIYVVCIDETPNEQLQANQSKSNEIPKEYANIKPQETVGGWRQGSGVSHIPSDARVPQNAQPPTIIDTD